MSYRLIKEVLIDIRGAGKRIWIWHKKPESLHDGGDPEAIIKDLERAGGEFQSREENIFLIKFPDGDVLVERAYGDYKIKDETMHGDPENVVALLPKW